MPIRDTITLFALAEAKAVGSEIVEEQHLFVGLVNFLESRELIDESSKLLKRAQEIHLDLLKLGLSGIKPPKLNKRSEVLLLEVHRDEDAKSLAIAIFERFENKSLGEFTSEKSKSKQSTKRHSVGDFHSVDGPSIARLPKIIVDKSQTYTLITPFLILDEELHYDGVYNTKDPQISTRNYNGQSLGRIFVTNHRLLFWSDDYDKPHIGAFYSDITYWKTNWMPLKSRGVVMNIGNKKVIFAANSNAVAKASEFINRLNGMRA
jgi:hypothetical protein